MLKWCSILLAGVMILTGCKTNRPNEDAIFFDYEITGEEGNDNLTILLQYRLGDRNGDAIVIDKPGSVTLDGEIILPDSSRMGGIYYELHQPIDSFIGKHEIVFTSPQKKEYREAFDFRPVVLLTVISDTIQRSAIELQFEGLEKQDLLRVLLTDTSFISNGINRVDAVNNNKLVISKNDLDRLANGPVQLELIREYSRPLKNGGIEGGRLMITYILKREFYLLGPAESQADSLSKQDLHK